MMSMDAAALFPSLNMKDILSGLWRLVLETPMSLLNVNMKEIGKYLYIMHTRDELVKHRVISCIPKRQVDIDGTARRAPTLAYLDNETYDRDMGGSVEKGIPKWNFEGVKKPSESQRGRMIALTLSITIKNIL